MSGVQPFNYTPGGNCATEWKNWLRSFEIFMQAIPDPDGAYDWCALLLHCAGQKVQQVYYSLDAEASETVIHGPLASGLMTPYRAMADRLTEFFAPKRNPTYERYVFKQMKQLENEKMDMFVVRLREQADKCEFGNNVDEFMKDQITACCNSKELRKKILRRVDCNLDQVLSLARIEESVVEEDKIFSNERHPDVNVPASDVNRIGQRPKFGGRWRNESQGHNKWRNDKPGQSCARCGRKGHTAKDFTCPAKDKKCLKCGALGHFAKKCFTKKRAADRDELGASHSKQSKIEEGVQWVENPLQFDDVPDEEDVYCVVSGKDTGNIIDCVLGGVKVKAVVDSGCKCNLIDEKTWASLKAGKVNIRNQRTGSDRTFKAYGGQELTVIGMFDAYILAGHTGTNATFYIIAGGGQFLLGRDTAQALEVLRIGVHVHAVRDVATFPKMRGIMVDIPIKRDVKPISQAYRRVPVPLDKAVNERIDNMVKQGIVEKVNGPSKWISPLVVVPRSNPNEIRICVDMRRANEAVERENHPLPTFDDFLPHLAKAKFYSKLDIKNAFHQVDMKH